MVVEQGVVREKDERYVVVPNVLQALQQLACWHRSMLNIPVIGITGSLGKTTTKALLATLLATKYRVHATVGNLNTGIGAALTLLAMPYDTEVAVVESAGLGGGRGRGPPWRNRTDGQNETFP